MTMKRQETEDLTTADLAAAADRDRSEAPPARRQAPAPDRPNEPLTPLFPAERVAELRRRWNELQSAFVDEPRETVKRADEVVAQVMKDLAQSFAEERARLESHWDKGDQISTEDLRQALKRYRSFFERFLSV
jgi:hypothetical protein